MDLFYFLGLYAIYFCSDLYDFFPSALSFVCSFSGYFRYKVRLFRDFSCFLRQDCVAVNFPLRTAFAVFHKFWIISSIFFSYYAFLDFLFDFFYDLLVI